jgi:hypothetical protein
VDLQDGDPAAQVGPRHHDAAISDVGRAGAGGCGRDRDHALVARKPSISTSSWFGACSRSS